MKIINPVMWLFIGVALCGEIQAQSSESFGFDGPDNAPIFVIEGSFSQNYTVNSMNFDVDWNMMMDPSSGSLVGTGNFAIDGYFYYYNWWGINFSGSVATAFTAKQAGTVLRVNGKMAMTGTGYLASYYVDRCAVNYTYSNLQVDSVAGSMSGNISAKGSVRVPGYGTYPVNVPRQYLAQELPDVNQDGEWDSTGEWTAEVDATVDAKGKIVGTGELTVWDEFGEAYDVIPQKVSGSLKKGVVALSATGNSKPTSKIKVNLTYLQSNDETVANKSSVSAYGQNRKF